MILSKNEYQFLCDVMKKNKRDEKRQKLTMMPMMRIEND